jgi:CheY-like chemotaxis protein
VNKIVKSLNHKASENLNQIEILFDDHFYTHLISDPLRIGQIITNLLSNAIKFTKNGFIKLQVKQLDATLDTSTFKVSIIDTGIGIDLVQFNHIFEKFTQAETKTSRNFGGTGLGLVITKKLLNLLGSEIQLESKINEGSNFYFTLKLPIDPQNSYRLDGEHYDQYTEKKMPGFKVLLVEDNPINVKIATKIISQWDIVIDWAENGQIAVEKHTPNKYDLVLMDLSMPVMDGYQASYIIRQRDKKIPIIALTASSSEGYIERSLEVGINEYVIKPFSPKELNIKLFKYFNALNS